MLIKSRKVSRLNTFWTRKWNTQASSTANFSLFARSRFWSTRSLTKWARVYRLEISRILSSQTSMIWVTSFCIAITNRISSSSWPKTIAWWSSTPMSWKESASWTLITSLRGAPLRSRLMDRCRCFFRIRLVGFSPRLHYSPILQLTRCL